MRISRFISRYATLPLGALGVTSDVRRVNRSTADVLPPHDTLNLPEDGTGTIRDFQNYLDS